MTQLNQLLAIEKGVATKVNGEYDQIYRGVKASAETTAGLARTYRKVKEDGDEYAGSTKLVQLRVEDALDRIAQLVTRRVDLNFTKAVANTEAKADIVIDGEAVLRDVPVTFLLELERECVQLLDFFTNLPTLDATKQWLPMPDPATGAWRTDVVTTHKTLKVEEPQILVQPTKEHPAQVRIVTKDIVEGYWDAVHYSGALPAVRKQELLDRLALFAEAVKMARERANTLEVTDQHAGRAIFEYLLGRQLPEVGGSYSVGGDA